jgi:predicted Zn-dependent protease
MPLTEIATIPPLSHPDSLYLSAASGWLDLGLASDAESELKQISSENQRHPQVLLFLWDMFAAQKRWTEAVHVAHSLEQIIPESPEGWIKHAYALHESGRTTEAWETLHHTLENFPKEFIIPYNLACYACQLGNIPEAIELLKRAYKSGGKSKVQRMAAKDPDLAPLKKMLATL